MRQFGGQRTSTFQSMNISYRKAIEKTPRSKGLIERVGSFEVTVSQLKSKVDKTTRKMKADYKRKKSTKYVRYAKP